MIRIWKVWDHGCPICAEMAKFDWVEIRARSAYYRQLLLSEVPNDERIMEYLKSNVVTDGSIDIPVYVVEWRGALIGHVQGQMDRMTFRRELIGIISKRKMA